MTPSVQWHSGISNPIQILIMRASLLSHYLLVFTSVLSLSRVTEAQTAPVTFYPFGSLEGDTVNIAPEDGNSTLIDLWSPFVFFGHTYNRTYVNNNGHLTFNQSQLVFNNFPINGSEDIIAPLWTDVDVSMNGIISYQQYSSGSVLTRATQDINQYFPDLTFTATWVLVATWDRVAYFYHSGTETSFQVVLISGGDLSFILMNYGDIAAAYNTVQAGYDTINSTAYFSIPGSNDGSAIPNLKNSTNVNVPGRWAFRVDGGSDQNRKENIIGLQMRVSSYSDLRESGKIETVLERIQQELTKYGLPSSLRLTLRRIQTIYP
ncbi:sushi, nidogen and EGF-like domain-containing protein 1 isoform X2 [Puntigrus tetrazona]|uniref:sushi, nidogen and EGF-like domain-containing protein 1 isoform X2 n=1 Tax=Puntigrus tetrazona TaxID=1606681 RepID=UPI001C8A714E|nr:sushi, nidogen and EGF-like domain-containing protein 1 isoform X2 [Puntigrus tetrazona]